MQELAERYSCISNYFRGPNSMSKKRILYLLGAFVCLALLILALAGRSRFPLFNRMVTAIILPVESGLTALGHLSDDSRGYWQAMTVLQDENEKLKKEVEELRNANINMVSIEAENRQLRELVSYKEAHRSQTTVGARVIARNFGDLRDTIYIDVGDDKGIKRDMAVVNNGLVGVIDEVYGGYSRVLLITSPRCRIGGRVLRLDSRAMGVTGGSNTIDGKLVMRHIYRTASIRQGDAIITSGISGNHPENILIGMVSSVKLDDVGLAQEAEIIPSSDIADVEHVLVVKDFTPEPKIKLANEGGQAK